METAEGKATAAVRAEVSCHQTRSGASDCGTTGCCARAPRREQSEERVGDAQEDHGGMVVTDEGEATTAVGAEVLRHQPRLGVRDRGTTGSRTRALLHGAEVERATEARMATEVAEGNETARRQTGPES